MKVENSVFISYRHTNSSHAHLIYRDLRVHGYDAFIDVESLEGAAHCPTLCGPRSAPASILSSS